MSGITFTVSNTTPTKTPSPIDFATYLRDHKVVKNNNGQVLLRTEPVNPVSPKFGNGFVGSAFFAYSQHHHLVLRPDDVWLAIVMTFANYVDAHAEEMRKSFVSHEGKKDLAVHVAGGNIVTVDWADIVKQFAGLVGVNTKSSVKEWIEPDFLRLSAGSNSFVRTEF